MAKDQRVEKWMSQGILDPSRVLGRIAAESAIEPAHEKLPSGTNELNEDAFVLLLRTKGGLPESCEGFGRLIYGIIAYLSTTPFCRRPGEPAPSSLSLAEVYRGMAWIFPDVHRRLVVAGSSARSRTVADHRRLIFQSLATATHNESFDPEEAHQRAHYNAHFEPDELYDNPDWLFINRDDDGDEIYHDVLDVLHATQPQPNFPYGDVRRDEFRELAKTLTKGQPKFLTLAIPLDRLIAFLTFSLALQFEPTAPGEPVLSRYEEAVKSLSASFYEEGKTDFITWPRFDDALKQMPFLLDPLYRILSAAFLQRQPPGISGDWLAPTPPEDSFMTLPRLSQLATMLNEDVDFENFGRAHSFHTGVRPTAEVLLNAMKTMPELSILAMYGLSSACENYIFGVFKPLPLDEEKDAAREQNQGEASDDDENRLAVREKDPIHDWVKYQHTVRCSARPILFVLSPAQRVLRLKGEPRVVDDRVHFGDVLSISNDGTASIRTGDAAVAVKTKAIEIWGEISTRSD